MFDRQQIKKILARAQEIDPGCEAFGASKHRYQFRPPLAADFVRKAEGQYGFRLPEDYFRFITEIGDGGAGPGYGIGPFAAASFQHLALPFELRPMQPDEVEEYAITSAENYAKSPERYFVYAEPDEDSPCAAAGFLVLGTHGCQWDFGLITAGGRFGQVFDIDNEGSCAFVAASFDEYYQLWLDWLADERKLRAEVNFWRRPTQ